MNGLGRGGENSSSFAAPSDSPTRPGQRQIEGRMRCLLFAILLLWVLLPGAAGRVLADTNENQSPLLTVRRIFDGSEFGGESFSGRWLEDGSAYTTWETSTVTSGGKDLVRHDPKSGERTVLVPAAEFVPHGESAPLAIEGHTWSKDRSRLLLYTHSKRVWRTNSRGDYWVLDRTSRELFKLGGEAPASSLQFAKFSPDGQRVAFVRERNLYVQDLRTRQVTALTRAETAEVINGTFDWVYEEEFALRDGFRWSPDGRYLAYWQLNTEGLKSVTLVDHGDGLYPRTQVIPYPKAGEQNAACRVGVVELATGQTKWMEVPGDPRNHYLFDLAWPEGSKELVVQQLNRLQNTNRVWLADPVTGQAKQIRMDRDDAWVEAHQDLKWLEGGRRWFAWSERDGWQHVYLARRNGRGEKRVTEGDYDVTALVHVDEKAKSLYFMASPDQPTQRYLYRATFAGGRPERLTPADQPGTHSYQVSADGRWAFHTWSRFSQPPRTELITLPDHAVVRVLQDNAKLQERLGRLAQPAAEFFRVPVSGGFELDAWCLRPPDFDPARKYPLLVYVYGEPAGSTVQDQWGGKGHLWHLMLAQQGYVVMSFDNRGTTAPRGRAWHKSIYRQVGILAPREQAEAVRHVLAQRTYLDPERVGVWGWSGGGSMTLNALLKFPDLYRVGISIASVPNQRLYDTIYQERYMGLPGDNVDGYRDGSALTFASQLKGELLLIHGTGDDNCHYQGAELLMNEFIRHQKQFRLMSYPSRSHSISEGAGTTVHLRELMTDFLREKLPPGGRLPGEVREGKGTAQGSGLR
jgi:dipeptidyl-peptidase-4